MVQRETRREKRRVLQAEVGHPSFYKCQHFVTAELIAPCTARFGRNVVMFVALLFSVGLLLLLSWETRQMKDVPELMKASNTMPTSHSDPVAVWKQSRSDMQVGVSEAWKTPATNLLTLNPAVGFNPSGSRVHFPVGKHSRTSLRPVIPGARSPAGNPTHTTLRSALTRLRASLSSGSEWKGWESLGLGKGKKEWNWKELENATASFQSGLESLSESLSSAMTLKKKKQVSEKEKREAFISGGLAAAGALAFLAVLMEVIQITGTAVVLYLAQRWMECGSPVETIAALINHVKSLGVAGYGVFSLVMIFFQVVPIAAAFGLTLSAGAIFGAAKGTMTVVMCSTVSATISFFIARSIGRAGLLEAAQKSKQFLAIDKAFRSASFRKSLTLITLLRLSPVLPFTWANYMFGLSPVRPAAFGIGTFLGCLPIAIAYVSAGQAGAAVVTSGPHGVQTNPWLIACGAVATLAAITSAGNIATDALKDLNIDLKGGDVELPRDNTTKKKTITGRED